MLKQILQEVKEAFDTKFDCKWVDGNVKLDIDGDLIEIIANEIDKDIIDFSFLRNGEQIALNLNKNSFKILSAVKHCLEEYIRLNNPEFIIFTSSDNHSKRNAIYKRLADHISVNYKYKLTKVGNFLPKDNDSWILYKHNLDKLLKYID